jgi:hypothetical protein
MFTKLAITAAALIALLAGPSLAKPLAIPGGYESSAVPTDYQMNNNGDFQSQGR